MNSKMFVKDIYYLNYMSFVTKMSICYLTVTSMFAKMYSSRYMQKNYNKVQACRDNFTDKVTNISR